MKFDMKTIKMIRETTEDQLREVALRLLVEDPSYFKQMLNGDAVVTFLVRGGFDTKIHSITREQLTELQNVTNADGFQGSTKVSTIKAIRVMFDLGLREAKDLCEKLAELEYLSVSFRRNNPIPDDELSIEILDD